MGLSNYGVAVSNGGRATPNPILTYKRQHNPHGFSFSDVNASLVMPFSSATRSSLVDLPACTLVSFSTHRDVYPVVGSGGRGIRGFTKGHQTVAGTLGFDSMGQGAFAEALHAYAEWRGYNGSLANLTPDLLPPMTLHLLLVKDYSESERYTESVGRISIFGLQIVDFSGNVSVRDVMLTEVYSFIAGGINYLLPDDSLYTLPNDFKNTGSNLDFLSATGTNASSNNVGVSPLESGSQVDLLHGILGGGVVTNQLPPDYSTQVDTNLKVNDRYLDMGLLKRAP